jgi:hypothetical protein
MQPRRLPALRTVLLVVFAGVAGGCAGTRSQAPAAEQAFAAAEAEAVFKAAYTAIADRYVRPVTTESVVAVALGGLSDIDAALAVGRVGDAVNLSAGGKQVAIDVQPEGTRRGWMGKADRSALAGGQSRVAQARCCFRGGRV